MTTLYLVRHGEAGDERINAVSYEPKNEYDKPLTELGLAQALKLGPVFKETLFDRSFTSDYFRAMETYEQMGVQTQSHQVLPQIRELYCECIGKNFGNTDLAEFKRQKQRVQQFIDAYLSDLSQNETVLVVAHGCFILYLLKQLTGVSFGHEVTHTGVTCLTFQDGWQLSFFNESSHLYEPVDPAITALFSDG
ncbi:histidine phosphatase family protein [Reinekea blandensis]|uniref:Phosphoglycerate mutase n=1 Tax=Reinekea blandensis MED297 TaxID=314283 RepID=A4BJM7_9GAMM|nr:histidine phosphatase family protein [Reinekea blandensis]EAR07667.1 Phosphoglycerate mutase [Reinekea sp. MED297] [Reinekea blandensis MED297]